MKKPVKKRPGDVNMRAHSIMQDVVTLGSKPIVAPSKRKKK
jgi:hypothetical protein